MKLTIGSKVRWNSQAGGVWKVKIGTVVGIVPPEKDPRGFVPTGFIVKEAGWGGRDHESYLIQVGRRRRLMWPLVKNLMPYDRWLWISDATEEIMGLLYQTEIGTASPATKEGWERKIARIIDAHVPKEAS